MSTFIQYTADGKNGLFNVPFPYISRKHVKVMVNGYVQVDDGHYDWLNDSTVSFRPAYIPQAGALVEIRRETPMSEQLVQFQNGAVLTEEELNLAVKQLLFITQELKDRYEARLEGALYRLSNGQHTTPEQIINAMVQEVLSSELLADLQARIGDIDLNAESILEQHTRLNTLQATIDALTNIDGTGIVTFIQNEQAERIEADEAFAETLALIGTKSPDGLSFILNLNTTKVSPTETLASHLSALRADVDNAQATILNEQNARIAGDQVLADTLALLGAKNAQGSAFILNTDAVMVDGSTSLATRLSGIEAKADNAQAAIITEQNARAAADSALSSQITTLQSTVNGHTASLQTHQSVIDGLTAQWMVKTDVNGRVAGIGLYNTGATSEFTVLADRFAIVHPTQGLNTPTVPFVVSGGVVYMRNVVIQDALIQSLTVSKLSNGILNADVKLGTGKIIFDNGLVMLVQGVGFGTNNQFIEWFGPKLHDINMCSEANAISYLKTNGDAYFGGALRSGSFTNQATSNDPSPTASVEIGPFFTHGRPKTVTFSYSLEYSAQSSSSENPGNPTAQIKLYRSYNNGPWTEVATLNVTGSRQSVRSVAPNVWWHEMVASGAQTFVDNMPGTQNFAYRAALVSRTTPGVVTSAITQSLSIISVE